MWNGKRLLSEDWIEQSTTSYSVTNAYMDFGYGMLWNDINPNEERESAVYPAADFVFVHRVATEHDAPFDQQNLYRIIGSLWAARR